MIVAFDVDDKLLTHKVGERGYNDTPNYEILNIYKWFEKNGDRIIVWSGGGEDYARMWCDKLGLKPDIICAKSKENAELHKPDIAFDDAFVNLAKVHIKVKNKGTHR